MAIRRARSARRAERVAEQAGGAGAAPPCDFFFSIHKQTQFTSPRTSFSPCCQPRMLPATHVASHASCQPRKLLATHAFALALAPPAMRCSTRPPRAQPAQRLLSPSPTRVQPVPRLVQAGPHAGLHAGLPACRPACRPAHADLTRQRLRLMPGLTTSATSSTSTSSSSTSTSSTSAAPSGPRAFFAGEPREGAIPVFGWQGGLLGSGPWPAPAGCAPPAGPAGLRRAVALHPPSCRGDTRALRALRFCFFYRTLTIRF
jgi:hypothetical protein